MAQSSEKAAIADRSLTTAVEALELKDDKTALDDVEGVEDVVLRKHSEQVESQSRRKSSFFSKLQLIRQHSAQKLINDVHQSTDLLYYYIYLSVYLFMHS